jgi:hypothetical protein
VPHPTHLLQQHIACAQQRHAARGLRKKTKGRGRAGRVAPARVQGEEEGGRTCASGWHAALRTMRRRILPLGACVVAVYWMDEAAPYARACASGSLEGELGRSEAEAVHAWKRQPATERSGTQQSFSARTVRQLHMRQMMRSPARNTRLGRGSLLASTPQVAQPVAARGRSP